MIPGRPFRIPVACCGLQYRDLSTAVVASSAVSAGWRYTCQLSTWVPDIVHVQCATTCTRVMWNAIENECLQVNICSGLQRTGLTAAIQSREAYA